jgi:membrane associated rhomboid family serine protease
MYGDDNPLYLGGLSRAVAVRVLLIATLVVFAVQYIADRSFGGVFTALFGLSRAGILHGAVWQLVTYLFLHGGFWHILMNMFGLVMFGREMEDLLGTRRFCFLYLGCGLLAGLGWLLISASGGPCIGASGAVFGVIGAFAAVFPQRRLTLLLFFVVPVTMTARTMAVTFGLITLMLLFTTDGNIAHAAHLAGGIAGYVYGREWVRRGGWIGIDRGGGLFGWATDLRARWRRRKLRVLSSEQDAPSPEEVDRLLDKIKAQGIGSLTRRERDALERASGARDAAARR